MIAVYQMLFLLTLCIGTLHAFYPVYKFDENGVTEEKKAVDTILFRSPSALLHQQKFPPGTRGAFISPLFGYRFMSNKPSASTIPAMPAQHQLTSSEEEELSDSLEEQPISKSNYYDPLFMVGQPRKRNFYTHIWRDIVQRMPAYRGGGHRHFQSAELEEPLLKKRNPADRMHAIRMG